MNKKILVKCPICGFDNVIQVDVDLSSSLRSFYCNVEEGGCDAHLVFTYTVSRVVTTGAIINLPFPS